MALFDSDDPNASVGYKNLKAARPGTIEALIKEGLQDLWTIYEPYADTNFLGEFARQPDPRFWEMYLATRLLAGRKKLVPRAELPAALRDTGPDICIRKCRRKIWIEAIAPNPGDDKNLDRVPDLFVGGDDLQDVPRRQIELRITGALWTKLKAFEKYRNEGIINENDSCIVAVSACQFSLEAAGEGLSHAVKAVYPFGEEFVELNRRTSDIVRIAHSYSSHIERAGKKDEPILRTAFQDERFVDISGLIWSRYSTGNFLDQPNDLVFVHNQVARKPIPRRWFHWHEQFYPIDNGTKLRMKKRRRT
jgi:hypothetical protein